MQAVKHRNIVAYKGCYRKGLEIWVGIHCHCPSPCPRASCVFCAPASSQFCPPAAPLRILAIWVSK